MIRHVKAKRFGLDSQIRNIGEITVMLLLKVYIDINEYFKKRQIDLLMVMMIALKNYKSNANS